MRPQHIAYGAAALVAVGATAVACSRLDLSVLKTAAPIWVAAALALNCASMMLRSLAWLGTLRGALPGVSVPVGGVIRATMIGVLASAVAPGRVGEGVRTWLVSRRLAHRNPFATVAGTVLSQTVLNVVALVALAAIAVPTTLSGEPPKAVLIVVAGPVALVISVLFWAQFVRRGWAARQLAALRSGLAVFRRARLGAAVSTLQFAAWGLQAFAAYALLFALHLHVAAPLATAAAVLFAVNVTAAVPVTPSNIGVFQAACVAVLATAGVAAGDGLAYGVLLQGVEIVTAVALGVPAAAVELSGAWASGPGASTRR
ncbi:lysylphosphatidylglycerol synthase transmembrane domain-containing protein [Solirubrobacter soli]|uniref:lysylphosphatidylglycerol synthase transmembrane domain-containing protein n=1 Tax=Solirubrobacter soli TaxID=363832 RepID=UPI0004018BC5|nr:lysylphosphatidylglycerol synthase transmembrane domain-containing protein [Solirubrobacter soli]